MGDKSARKITTQTCVYNSNNFQRERSALGEEKEKRENFCSYGWNEYPQVHCSRFYTARITKRLLRFISSLIRFCESPRLFYLEGKRSQMLEFCQVAQRVYTQSGPSFLFCFKHFPPLHTHQIFSLSKVTHRHIYTYSTTHTLGNSLFCFLSSQFLLS